MSSNPNEAPNPDHYALVIGIDSYKQLPPLEGSVSDATKFAEWLKDPRGGGLPARNVQLVLSPPQQPANPLEAQPFDPQIETALMHLGITPDPPRRRIGARLYVYFAGHGFGPTFDNVGLLMANAALNRLNNNLGLMPMRFFLRRGRIFDEIIFILDCCRDNKKADTFAPFRNSLTTVIGMRQVTGIRDFVLLGAQYGAQAFTPYDPLTEKRRGLLTEAVLNGLRGAAADMRGRVTAGSLAQYVKREVPAALHRWKQEAPSVRKVRRGQTPEEDMRGPTGELVLATVPPDSLPRVPVQIVARNGLGGELLLMEGRELADLKEVARRRADQATDQQPWTQSLLKSQMYLMIHLPSGKRLKIDPSKTQDGSVVRF